MKRSSFALETTSRSDCRPADGKLRKGLTVLELLVTMAITGILVSLVLPAIGAARESARRITCVSHLREIGLALQSHHDSVGHLPAGWRFDSGGESAYGWAVSLLPYFGHPSLHDQIDMSAHVGSSCNDRARRTALDLMLCPSDIATRSFVLYADNEAKANAVYASAKPLPGGLRPLLTLPTTNYVGVFGTFEPDDEIPAPVGDGSFIENRHARFRDFQRGLSHTIVVGERTMAQVPSTWFGIDLSGEDAAARVVGSTLEGINNPYADECDFSSRHSNGANFLWADGHVSFLAEDIDLSLYHQYARLRD